MNVFLAEVKARCTSFWCFFHLQILLSPSSLFIHFISQLFSCFIGHGHDFVWRFMLADPKSFWELRICCFTCKFSWQCRWMASFYWLLFLESGCTLHCLHMYLWESWSWRRITLCLELELFILLVILVCYCFDFFILTRHFSLIACLCGILFACSSECYSLRSFYSILV